MVWLAPNPVTLKNTIKWPSPTIMSYLICVMKHLNNTQCGLCVRPLKETKHTLLLSCDFVTASWRRNNESTVSVSSRDDNNKKRNQRILRYCHYKIIPLLNEQSKNKSKTPTTSTIKQRKDISVVLILDFVGRQWPKSRPFRPVEQAVWGGKRIRKKTLLTRLTSLSITCGFLI